MAITTSLLDWKAIWSKDKALVDHLIDQYRYIYTKLKSSKKKPIVSKGTLRQYPLEKVESRHYIEEFLRKARFHFLWIIFLVHDYTMTTSC